MGNAAVVRLPEQFALAQRVICFRPYGAVDHHFLVLQILAEPFQSILDLTATGLTAKGIKAAKLKRLPVAIPPLAEQYRIVAKVDELMALCDRLEEQLTTAQNESHRLLEAVLEEALNGDPPPGRDLGLRKSA
jgi:type I restriction enzyme S subunit